MHKPMDITLQRERLHKWLTPGIGVKRWLLLLLVGGSGAGVGFAYGVLKLLGSSVVSEIASTATWPPIVLLIAAGLALVVLAVLGLTLSLLAPYRRNRRDTVVDVIFNHSQRQGGIKVVAVGGGTGLPATLRGLKRYTGNITAIVTVADDGGSSGRLRRELGVLPPGDLRNNIVALADDESLLTKLFQFRFQTGDLAGHSFGNLFIAAMANVAGEPDDNKNSLAEALIEVENVLNIQGRVLPATLDDVQLTASIRLNKSGRSIKIMGEAQTGDVDGCIESVSLNPTDVKAYPDSIKALLNADVIVIGPGSLYTSILPNLLVKGIADALRATHAYKIYVCNVAQQPVETVDYTVADHIIALEKHIGRGVFHAVLANNVYPSRNAGVTRYVMPAADNHEILQRYEVRYTDLCDAQRPWRHDPKKLAIAILDLCQHAHISAASFIRTAS